MTTHLRFEMVENTEHPQAEMKKLGITYQHATPQSIGEQWWFWNCEGIPERLPKFLTVLDTDPMKCIGYGLSKEDALKIIGYEKALHCLNCAALHKVSENCHPKAFAYVQHGCGNGFVLPWDAVGMASGAHVVCGQCNKEDSNWTTRHAKEEDFEGRLSTHSSFVSKPKEPK